MFTNKFYIVLLFCLPVISSVHAQGDFSIIRSKICEQMEAPLKESALHVQADGYLGRIKIAGNWDDINYKDSSVTNWLAVEHLDRIKILALVFNKKEDDSGNEPLYQAIVKGLRFWYEADPKSTNWWHNEINAPQLMGEILLLMKESKRLLPRGLEDSLVQRMKKGNPYAKTGANKLDIAIHYLYRACITENRRLMDSAVDQAFQPLQFTNEEGLQFDYSYLQHGRQLQISSYGLVFLTGEYEVASWLAGTSYALKGARLALLNHYLLGSFLPAIRGRYIDFNTEGRGISRPGILDKSRIALDGSLLQAALSLAGPSDRQLIVSASERIRENRASSYRIKPSHLYFWKGDYTMHLRSDYSFNVRTASVRTKRTESGNGENLLGKFLPDGSTNLQRGGKEYFNIMPVWEWDKLPGITSRDFKTDQSINIQWGEVGSTRFVGGVSDSLYGATAYDMDYNGVKAKKAWFFFDREVVALGAGIRSKGDEPVVSTVNQCWSAGEATVLENSKVKTSSKYFQGRPYWVWQDSIGYFFPESGSVFVSNDLQSGTWRRINSKNSDKRVEGKVFKLWIDHGLNPESGSYAYITVPGITVDKMRSYPVNHVRIIANNDSVQAVIHEDLKMLQAVFYLPTTIEGGFVSVKVDQPCILMIRRNNQGLFMDICDPTQSCREITVSIQKTIGGAIKKIACKLPEGDYAGSTARFVVE